MKVLLIEDDEIFIGTLSSHLSQQNYTVEAVDNAKLGWEYAHTTTYDLLIIDINLPDLNGISLCQKFRQASYKGAILLLTGKDDNLSKVNGLDAGADDYVVKSCSPDEIYARIRAILRRPRELSGIVLRWDNLQLDQRTCQVSYGQKVIALSPKEYGLLELFLRSPKQIFNSETLLERLWSFDETPGEETVRTHIKRLRRKLKRAGAGQVIENIYGMGYRLMAPPDSTEFATHEQAKSHQETTVLEPQAAASTPLTSEIARQAAVSALSKFRPILLERLAVLDEAVLASEAGNWSQAWQHRAYQAAHKLAGSLGLFGLSEGTKICQSLEAELQQNIKSSTIGTASPNFSSLVAQLHQAIDTALVTSSHASTEVRKYAPRTEALLPELLVISDSASWLSEVTEIAANKTYRISATSRHEAHSHINQGSSNVIVLDMTAEELWQDYLVFLASFAKQDAVISVIAITQADDFETRLAITRCSRKCICLPKSTDLQLILDYAVERSRQQKISNLHIIAVDDDPSILTAIEDQLKFQGIKVTTLGNPNHLWDKLSMIDSPDVILLDFEMPNVNGIELCQVIRSDRRWQELPILFLSACRDADIVQQMYQAGADGYIAKPFIVSDLITCIRHCIGRHHPPQI